eukprot:4006426-Amphidinium_carterae.1
MNITRVTNKAQLHCCNAMNSYRSGIICGMFWGTCGGSSSDFVLTVFSQIRGCSPVASCVLANDLTVDRVGTPLYLHLRGFHAREPARHSIDKYTYLHWKMQN